MSAPVARRIVLEGAAHIGQGSLRAELPSGEVRTFGVPGREPEASIRVNDDAAFSRVLTGGEIAAGETYMDGLWDSPNLEKLLELGILNREHAPPMVKRLNDLSRSASRALHMSRNNTHEGSRDNVSAHYDLGNDFFRLFLDETLTYSCAVFASPEQPLADAQRNKYHRLCEKAGLFAGDHLLEIGSGWGGFAIYAAQNYGCRVTTITISKEQHGLATERVADAGLSDRVKVLYSDYRDVTGSFDKIVSIEMFEAVGAEYFETYFQKCDAVLKAGGRMALQTIAVPDRTFEDLRDGVNWMQKYIFPGGMLPSLEALQRASRSTSLRITDIEDVGKHYPPTLRAWRHRFFDNIDAVRALGFDERFVRMWEYYLCASEAGFTTRSTSDLQLVLDKSQ
ncbi:MAG TPA: cyclopropane-fatty-acyl-phospholipid synthase family protein [Dehalococcoidia bacterium]